MPALLDKQSDCQGVPRPPQRCRGVAPLRRDEVSVRAGEGLYPYETIQRPILLPMRLYISILVVF